MSVTLSDGETYSVKIHQKPHPAAKMSVVIVPADEGMQPVGGIRNGMWSFCLDEIELGENTEDVNFFIMPDTYLHLYYGYRYEGREKIEEIFYDIFTKFSNKVVSPRPFRRLTYQEAMERYGTDKPDLRNPLIIEDASTILENTTFKPFQKSTIKVIV